MQENNIHLSYPNTVIVHRGNQVVFLALPAGVTWGEARATYVNLMNCNPHRTLLTPFFIPGTSDTPAPYKDESYIEFPNNNISNSNTLHAMAVEAGLGGTLTAFKMKVRPIETRGREVGTLPPAVSEYLKGIQSAPYARE